MLDPRLSQAAALLHAVLLQKLPAPCSLEAIETVAQQLSQQVGREAAEQHAQSVVAHVEATRAPCACGRRPVAEQRRPRQVLLLLGLIQLLLRRYRCPGCGTWSCPAAQGLHLEPRQRMTRPVKELLCRLGLSWSYAAAAHLLAK